MACSWPSEPHPRSTPVEHVAATVRRSRRSSYSQAADDCRLEGYHSAIDSCYRREVAEDLSANSFLNHIIQEAILQSGWVSECRCLARTPPLKQTLPHQVETRAGIWRLACKLHSKQRMDLQLDMLLVAGKTFGL